MSCLVVYADGDSSTSIDVAAVCAKIWRCDIPTKVAVLVWRFLFNRLATYEALFQRGTITSTRDLCCVFLEYWDCRAYVFSCSFSFNVWSMIFAWLGCTTSTLWNHVKQFMQLGSLFKGKKLKGVRHLVWQQLCGWCGNQETMSSFKGLVAPVNLSG